MSMLLSLALWASSALASPGCEAALTQPPEGALGDAVAQAAQANPALARDIAQLEPVLTTRNGRARFVLPEGEEEAVAVLMAGRATFCFDASQVRQGLLMGAAAPLPVALWEPMYQRTPQRADVVELAVGMHVPVAPQLVAWAATDEAPALRQAAARLAVRLPAEERIALEPLWRDTDPMVRAEALRTATRLKLDAAPQWAREALGEPLAELRLQGVRSLGALDGSSLVVLEALVNDPDARVRSAVRAVQTRSAQ